MGVKGLWTLLEPCGRRIDVQALRGKKLAIDASVWIFRFLKAMRDERGDPLPNAHLIGFLRRICKLLYLNVWPVFVFDGSTPALKRRTVQERRKRREQQQARVKRTAEKLLLNRLKQYALSQVKNGEIFSSNGDNRGRDIMVGEVSKSPPETGGTAGRQEEVAAVAIQADHASSSSSEFEVNVDDGVDPEVLSTLPPSMQLEIMLQVREKKMNAARGGFELRNGKPEEFSQYQMQQYLNSTGLRRQLDTIRGVSTQETDIARRVAGEEETHYVLYREDPPAEEAARLDDIGNGAFASPSTGSTGLVGKRALNITFEVEGGGREPDGDDMEWEDVDEDDSVVETAEQRHRRSKYWSLSHGFQKGRSLGNWGAGEGVENDQKDGAPDGLVAADGGAAPIETVAMTSLDGLIDDEQGMIEEAIRRSLKDVPVRSNGDVDLTAEGPKGDVETMLSEPAVPHSEGSDRKMIEPVDNAESEAMRERLVTSSPISPRLEASTGKAVGTELGTENPPVDAAVAEKGEYPVIKAPKVVRVVLDADAKSTSPCPPAATLLSSVDKEPCARPVMAREPTRKDVEKLHQTRDVEPEEAPKDNLDIRSPEKVPSHMKTIEPRGFTESKDETRPPPLAAPLPDLSELIQEESLLRANRRKASGQGDSPTDQMFTECQELLQLFGIPYIIAPTEAEAQCAWLDSNGLVDGVVTDDNDAFLFGARRVYRHIFEESKYVEEYRTDDVERELGLSRESLISLALLLGSDYTPGIAGVGIVNAVEIMSTFPGYDGLVEFEKWVNGIDEDIIALAGEISSSGVRASISQKKEFKNKHKSARTSWVLPNDFPSKEVMDAYRAPGLDKSKEKFTLTSPDFTDLSKFCMTKLGWDESRTTDLLDPVRKALKTRDSQLTLDGFVFREKFAVVKSKRLAKAVETVKRNKKRRESACGEEGANINDEPPHPRKQAPKKQAPKKQVRKKRDPKAPKKASSAYIFFSNAKRAEVKAANPELKGIGDIANRLGEMWKTLNDAEKEPYNNMALADKERYKQEMASYQERFEASLMPGHRGDGSPPAASPA